MKIPLDPEGYSVDQESVTVHTRYARDHAPRADRTRTAKGVETLLNGKKGTLCAVCYPSPVYPSRARVEQPEQQRRTPATTSTTTSA